MGAFSGHDPRIFDLLVIGVPDPSFELLQSDVHSKAHRFQLFVSVLCKATPALGEISNAERLIFDLSMLKVATDNFADFQKLGQGGFGTVYKGRLPNGEDIAVKRLSASSRQGIEELKNELILVAKLQHKNLVRLHCVCLVEDETLLVYEYMPNGSLDNFLFDPAKCKQLNWERRFKIIKGIARGLLYLHEECPLKVIHRDLKASNILLDIYLQPKIADFGLARLFGEDETQHITNRVVGTFGYMAPEYARRGHFSMKADIYSFGILVLEIVTGKRCTGFQYDSEVSQDILSYTWEHWKNGTALEVIDPSMGQNYSSSEVLRCTHIGLLCAQNLPDLQCHRCLSCCTVPRWIFRNHCSLHSVMRISGWIAAQLGPGSNRLWDPLTDFQETLTIQMRMGLYSQPCQKERK